MKEIIINLPKEFTNIPGSRYRKLGPNSGQEFREDFLEKHFRDINDYKIIIKLDGALGYPCGFLEEAFGGLARIFGKKAIKERLVLNSIDIDLINEIYSYIDEN